VKWVGISAYQRLAIDDVVRFQAEGGDTSGPYTIALDGERELELSTTSLVEVKLRADGPFVVDVPAALEAAAHAGHLQR
jgi:hypothetical protein